ncbi:MAG: hypothetical protein ACE5JS_14605, partial [Nitrospinota bacterium]
MRNCFLRALPILFVAILFSGCASVSRLDQMTHPKVRDPLKETERLLNEARATGKDKECPALFQEAAKLRRDAEATYWSYRPAQAAKMAASALEKARAICPVVAKKDSDGDGV